MNVKKMNIKVLKRVVLLAVGLIIAIVVTFGRRDSKTQAKNESSENTTTSADALTGDSKEADGSTLTVPVFSPPDADASSGGSDSRGPIASTNDALPNGLTVPPSLEGLDPLPTMTPTAPGGDLPETPSAEPGLAALHTLGDFAAPTSSGGDETDKSELPSMPDSSALSTPAIPEPSEPELSSNSGSSLSLTTPGLPSLSMPSAPEKPATALNSSSTENKPFAPVPPPFSIPEPAPVPTTVTANQPSAIPSFNPKPESPAALTSIASPPPALTTAPAKPETPVPTLGSLSATPKPAQLPNAAAQRAPVDRVASVPQVNNFTPQPRSVGYQPAPLSRQAPAAATWPRAQNVYGAGRAGSSTRTAVAPVSGRRHRVGFYDNLENISSHYYGSPQGAKVLFEANRHVLQQPDVLPIGAQLIIPQWKPPAAAAARTAAVAPGAALQNAPRATIRAAQLPRTPVRQPRTSLVPVPTP